MRLPILIFVGVFAALAGVPAAAQDRQEGYYYPEIGSSEVYEARVPTMPDSDRPAHL